MNRAMIIAHMFVNGVSGEDAHASPENVALAKLHLYPNWSTKRSKAARQDHLQAASRMIAALQFLDERLTRWAFLHAPALRRDPCFHLSLLFSKAASPFLVLITVHAAVYVLVARCTYLRET
jgi:hypothetical protein